MSSVCSMPQAVSCSREEIRRRTSGVAVAYHRRKPVRSRTMSPTASSTPAASRAASRSATVKACGLAGSNERPCDAAVRSRSRSTPRPTIPRRGDTANLPQRYRSSIRCLPPYFAARLPSLPISYVMCLRFQRCQRRCRALPPRLPFPHRPLPPLSHSILPPALPASRRSLGHLARLRQCCSSCSSRQISLQEGSKRHRSHAPIVRVSSK